MPVRVIASPRNWIEGEAVAQLRRTAELPGMVEAIGLPDLHPGKGAPIGAAFLAEGIVYPHLVGNDVGCGMALLRTDLEVPSSARLDRWVRRLTGLDGPWDGDTPGWLAEAGVVLTPFDDALGTIGGGNHFAELQKVAAIVEAGAFADLGLDASRLVLLVHSGSRGLGERVLREHVDRFAAGGLADESAEAAEYLARHDHALAWARANRALIAHRFLAALGARAELLLDVCHNSVQRALVEGRSCWLHRKGATPSDNGPVVVAGSRGTLSYLVAATGDQSANLATLAHGAGRKWRRGEAKERLRQRFSPQALAQTPLGGRVICEDRDLIYEEAPQAYKNVAVVVQDLVEAGLARVIATLSPLITYKTRIR